MSRLSFLAIASLPLTLLACDLEADDSSDDTEPSDTVNMPHCDEVSTAMDPSEVRFGVLGADFAFSAPLRLDGVADFEGMDSSSISVDFIVDESSLRFIESTEAPMDGDGPVAEIAVNCFDRMEVEAELSLMSADGQLDERIDVVMSIEDDGMGGDPMPVRRLNAELDPELLQGSLNMADYTDPGSFDTIDMFLSGSLSEDGLEAELSAMGEEANGQTVTVMNIPIAQMSAFFID